MEKKIMNILTEIRPEFNFEESSNFSEDAIFDSFDIVQLVVSLDNEFGISIDGLDILPENFSTIDSIVQLLKKNGVSR
jgi:acyl carrier protein